MCKHRHLSAIQKKLRRDILQISFDQGYSHLGSCLSVVDVLWAIYSVKGPADEVVLSSGHAAVAWYVVLAELGHLPFDTISQLMIHPNRQPQVGIQVSSGSLGQGLPIAVGMALANRQRQIWCVVSDGECAEGSVWEAARIAAQYQLTNLRVVLNANGWAAYQAVDLKRLTAQWQGFGWQVASVAGHSLPALRRVMSKPVQTTAPQLILAKTTVNQLPAGHDQAAHYYHLTKSDLETALEWYA